MKNTTEKSRIILSLLKISDNPVKNKWEKLNSELNSPPPPQLQCWEQFS